MRAHVDSPAIDEPLAEPAAGINFNQYWRLIPDHEDSKKIGWLQQNASYELAVPKMKRLSWQLSFSPTMNYRKLAGSQYTRVHSDAKNITQYRSRQHPGQSR